MLYMALKPVNATALVGNQTWAKCLHCYVINHRGNVAHFCLSAYFLTNKARNRKKLTAMAGNRTQVNCLEGSYAHHYTTITGKTKYSLQIMQHIWALRLKINAKGSIGEDRWLPVPNEIIQKCSCRHIRDLV